MERMTREARENMWKGEAVQDAANAELSLLGIDCATCAGNIESALGELDGVRNVHVNTATATVHVTYRPSRTRVRDLVERIEERGYRVGRETVRVRVRGMHCASCVAAIEGALRRTPGVLKAEVNPATETATVDYLTSLADFRAVKEAVESTGYFTAELLKEEQPERESEDRLAEYRSLMRKFWFAAAVSVPVLLTAYPQFIPVLRELSQTALRWIWAADGLLTLPVLLYSGRQFLAGAVSSFRHRSADMNTLIGLGITAAWLYSVVAIAAPGMFPTGTAEPFFDVTAVVTALVVLGQALEVRAKGRT